MKKTIYIFSLVFIISCSQNKNIIKKNRIGNYTLNEKLKGSIDRTVFDISVYNDNKIRSIITYSKIYKTKDGFSVGTNFKEILLMSNSLKVQSIGLNKGKSVVGNIGNGIYYNDIMFVDNNGDEVVDFIWVQNKKE